MENCNPTDGDLRRGSDDAQYARTCRELYEYKKENRELRGQVKALLSLLNGPDK